MTPRDRQLAIAGCGLALGALIPVALYQSGAVMYLVDPPSEWFDSERVVSSKTARPLGVPDSYLGLASYGTTMGLLLLSGRAKWASRLLGAKLIGDAGLATFNVVRQVAQFRKLCSWCTGTALATALVVYGGRQAIAAVVRESKDALG